jgi:hypothetical protein
VNVLELLFMCSSYVNCQMMFRQFRSITESNFRPIQHYSVVRLHYLRISHSLSKAKERQQFCRYSACGTAGRPKKTGFDPRKRHKSCSSSFLPDQLWRQTSLLLMGTNVFSLRIKRPRQKMASHLSIRYCGC